MFFPGILPLYGMEFAVPASVLAALIERPFFLRAGVTRDALRLSLRANLASMLVGFCLTLLLIAAIYIIGPLWCVIAVGVSIAVEGHVVKGAAPADGQLRWRWIALGNILSSTIVLLLPPLALWLKQSHLDWSWCRQTTLATVPYRALYWSTLLASCAAFAYSLTGEPRILAIRRNRQTGVSDAV
ncbi:MAG: hypothetical protein CMJ58_07105 [Planctomycetaceae bacterium]|nr:hypothetical protein [Planctomycetaceae bacterium]